jgi:hypothetical protein
VSDGTDETSTEVTEPIAQRIVLANEATSILMKSRRLTPFAGLAAIPAEQIIGMAEYLRVGREQLSLDLPDGEYVEVINLHVGDTFLHSDQPYVLVRIPRVQGTKVTAKVRPQPGGIAHLVDWDIDSTVRLLYREPAPVGEGFVNVPAGQLTIGDVILDFGDGEIEPERVTRLERPKVGRLVEVTTVTESIPEVSAIAETRPMPERQEVAVRLPRPDIQERF